MTSPNSRTSRVLRVWNIIDRKPGHRNLTRGITAALATQHTLEVRDLTPPVWATFSGKVLQRFWPLGTSLCHLPTPDNVPPDLIIGSGGNVLWVTAALGRRIGCPSVFVGSRRQLPPDAITCFVHYNPQLASEGALCLPVLPGPSGRIEQIQAWKAWSSAQQRPETNRHPVALIGGDGSGYRWNEADARAVAQLIVSRFAADGKTWLIATSRRTSAAFETALRTHVPPAAIADACWFHQGDQRRIVATYLGGASCVHVGEDSMSMIHEAMSSQQPVITFAPRGATPATAHLRYLEHAANSGWLHRHSLGTNLSVPIDTEARYAGDVLVNAGAALLYRLRSAGYLTP